MLGFIKKAFSRALVELVELIFSAFCFFIREEKV